MKNVLRCHLIASIISIKQMEYMSFDFFLFNLLYKIQIIWSSNFNKMSMSNEFGTHLKQLNSMCRKNSLAMTTPFPLTITTHIFCNPLTPLHHCLPSPFATTHFCCPTLFNSFEICHDKHKRKYHKAFHCNSKNAYIIFT